MPAPEDWMRLAIELAKAGQGAVEPNPMVGCVITHDNHRIGQGWHETYGGPHAEVQALASVSSADRSRLTESTVYVTLEPCSHHGKTGPCSQALIDANVRRVIVAVKDPNPEVAGTGIEQLRQAGIEVKVGLLQSESQKLLSPYLKRRTTGLPWVIAKWAMTIDGKIATASGDSQWITNDQSRANVHRLRSRVDSIMVGIGTVISDDPMLNARLENQDTPMRIATRVVLDSQARTPLESKLVATCEQYPVLIATVDGADADRCEALRQKGCQLFSASSKSVLPRELLTSLCKQGATNVMIEGGGQVLGAFFDDDLVDEVQMYIGPKLIGDAAAISPVTGLVTNSINDADNFDIHSIEQFVDDICVTYRKKQL
ncbi:MAG: bifunctional diaminohydroxyphosphoribosylaminopyrimidine deaminase/5-amino-6-(5-phosphoribosylamino)uracil reductase RibD [Planctomycetota bacterium]